jgi:HAD superfamily hydrolase (TIGR01490 family)
MTKRRFAAFDIDGTLIRWQLYHAVFDELARRGHIPASDYQHVRDLRMKWKQRDTAEAYKTYELAMVDIYESLMPSIPVKAYQAVARDVADKYKGQVYTYTRSLIKELKAKDYMILAISGSHQDLLDYVAPMYGFDVWAGSTYEHADGYYTGERYIAGFYKEEILRNLIQQHDLAINDSYGVGDSASDIPMLNMTEHAVAFNPNRQLLAEARKHGWRIVVERKDVVYELTNIDGPDTSVKIIDNTVY